ncbi:MAG TPA: aspartate aminotransferase family protein [Acidimicrobiales bacterium]
MTSTDAGAGALPDAADLDDLARRHLWMHFTRLGGLADRAVPMMVRGRGAHVWDQHGRRYLDALSGLFVVQVGHGRTELAEVAARQAETLAYFPIWGYAHPTAVELAARLARLAPGDLNRVFFTSGGSEAVESAWKLARQYFRAVGQPQRTKVVSRATAYHGTTMGALSITGVPALRTPFEPLVPGAHKAASTDRYRCRHCASAPACTLACADDIEDVILREGPETVAAVFLEPVQNAGGCYTPADGYFERVRQVCDRHGVLLVSDEVICAFGRLGHMFGCERYGYRPDIITCAKGLTSGYSPLGAVLASDRLAEPFLSGSASFAHGFTFAGHPVSCAVALANLDIFDEEDLLARVRANEPGLRDRLEGLRDLPVVGDVRGAGYFWALELVKDRDTRATFTPEESEALLRGFLAGRLHEAGLVCRTDDRAHPVVQLAPPLVCGPDELDRIESILRTVLTEAGARVGA